MNMYVLGNELKISVQNLPEFKRLLEQAKKQAEQLDNTIASLSRFELSVLFSAEPRD